MTKDEKEIIKSLGEKIDKQNKILERIMRQLEMRNTLEIITQSKASDYANDSTKAMVYNRMKNSVEANYAYEKVLRDMAIEFFKEFEKGAKKNEENG